jgi:hypothetical protein
MATLLWTGGHMGNMYVWMQVEIWSVSTNVLQLLEYAAQQYGGQYIGYGMDHPAPSKETIMPNIERVLIASAPFQEFIMTTRRVYRWENRVETIKYLLIYVVLWATNLLFPGMVGSIPVQLNRC